MPKRSYPRTLSVPTRASVLRAVALSIAACLIVGPTASSEPARKRPHLILLLTLDTIRMDHLSVYGYSKPTTPNLERLAQQGVRVVGAVSPMPTTDPSHASILTGLYPRTHGIRTNGQPLARPAGPNLASWAQELGYRTGAFVSRALLRPSGLAIRGFDHEDGPKGAVRSGKKTVARATAWLEEDRDSPALVWVHLFEPHWKYDPPKAFARRFAPKGARADKTSSKPSGLREPYTAERIAANTGLYDGEIAYADFLSGELFKAVRSLSPSGEDPLIIVAGDHGELMDEFDERMRIAFGHSGVLYQGLLQVPLLFSWPGVVPAGVSVQGPVELIDIAPTLADLLGAPLFENQGKSLVPEFAEGRSGSQRMAFSERRTLSPERQERFNSVEQYALQDQRYKLILSMPPRRTEFYDLLHDPKETQNLVGQHPEIEARMLKTLEQWILDTGLEAEEAQTVPEYKLETLRELGYVE